MVNSGGVFFINRGVGFLEGDLVCSIVHWDFREKYNPLEKLLILQYSSLFVSSWYVLVIFLLGVLTFSGLEFPSCTIKFHSWTILGKFLKFSP